MIRNICIIIAVCIWCLVVGVFVVEGADDKYLTSTATKDAVGEWIPYELGEPGQILVSNGPNKAPTWVDNNCPYQSAITSIGWVWIFFIVITGLVVGLLLIIF